MFLSFFLSSITAFCLDIEPDERAIMSKSLAIFFAGTIKTTYVQRRGLRDRSETMGKTSIRKCSRLAGYFAVDNQFEFRLRFRKRRDDLETIHLG